MNIWYVKTSSNGEYIKMKTPSKYSGECEDLDANTYRSSATGNMFDTVITPRWSKLSFSYNCLSREEYYEISEYIKANPIYAKCMHPIYSGGYIEAEFRCSKSKWEMLETGDFTFSFNLVQKKKVSEQ